MARRRRDAVMHPDAASMALSMNLSTGVSSHGHAAPRLTALQLAERELSKAESAWLSARHGGRALMRDRFGEQAASATLEQLRSRVLDAQSRVMQLRAQLRGAA